MLGIVWIMSNVAEIETAIHALTLSEQEELLRDLEGLVRARRAPAGKPLREEWANRLEALRASIGTGVQTLSGEQILDEMREER